MVVLLVACGGNGEGGTSIFGDKPDAGNTTSPDAPGGNNGTTDPALEGTWRWDGCATTDKEQIQIRFAGTTVEYTGEYHRSTDTTCATPINVIRMIQKYTLRGPSALAAGATKIDYRFEGMTLMTTDSQIASQWNTNYYCGRNDWAVNTARDITGRTCTSSDGSSGTNPSIGDMTYDIYKVDAAKLYWGDTASGTGETDALRPTKLATGYYSR